MYINVNTYHRTTDSNNVVLYFTSASSSPVNILFESGFIGIIGVIEGWFLKKWQVVELTQPNAFFLRRCACYVQRSLPVREDLNFFFGAARPITRELAIKSTVNTCHQVMTPHRRDIFHKIFRRCAHWICVVEQEERTPENFRRCTRNISKWLLHDTRLRREWKLGCVSHLTYYAIKSLWGARG